MLAALGQGDVRVAVPSGDKEAATVCCDLPLSAARGAALGLLVLGCATAPAGTYSGAVTAPEEHILGLLVLSGEPVELPVLKRGVSAQHCGGAAGSSGNLGTAVEQALAAVEGANVLINASVYTRQRDYRVCVEVRGDAAALY